MRYPTRVWKSDRPSLFAIPPPTQRKDPTARISAPSARRGISHAASLKKDMEGLRPRRTSNGLRLASCTFRAAYNRIVAPELRPAAVNRAAQEVVGLGSPSDPSPRIFEYGTDAGRIAARAWLCSSEDFFLQGQPLTAWTGQASGQSFAPIGDMPVAPYVDAPLLTRRLPGLIGSLASICPAFIRAARHWPRWIPRRRSQTAFRPL